MNMFLCSAFSRRVFVADLDQTSVVLRPNGPSFPPQLVCFFPIRTRMGFSPYGMPWKRLKHGTCFFSGIFWRPEAGTREKLRMVTTIAVAGWKNVWFGKPREINEFAWIVGLMLLSNKNLQCLVFSDLCFLGPFQRWTTFNSPIFIKPWSPIQICRIKGCKATFFVCILKFGHDKIQMFLFFFAKCGSLNEALAIGTTAFNCTWGGRWEMVVGNKWFWAWTSSSAYSKAKAS